MFCGTSGVSSEAPASLSGPSSPASSSRNGGGFFQNQEDNLGHAASPKSKALTRSKTGEGPTDVNPAERKYSFIFSYRMSFFTSAVSFV